MRFVKACAAAAGLCLGIMMAPSALDARPLGTVQGMPFFGLPYPNYYIYHPPKICYDFQEVYDPLEGPKTVPIPVVCGEPVTARY